MVNYNFAAFILTNNRSTNVKTLYTLDKCGYTGRIVLVLDDMDESIESYREAFPENEIYVFNKKEMIDKTDTADNTEYPNAVVYARNACFDIANKLGLDYFLVLDDDYNYFNYRSDENDNYKESSVSNLDDIFNTYLKFLETTPSKCIAMSQNGDFIGGVNGTFGKAINLHRKCMNSFFCKTDRPFEFYGLINEDVNMYVLNGSRGDLYFTNSHTSLKQTDTQQSLGGLTTVYLALGTYVKSFYSVIYHPSSVSVAELPTANKRLHHRINKNYTYPKILREELKKV